MFKYLFMAISLFLSSGVVLASGSKRVNDGSEDFRSSEFITTTNSTYANSTESTNAVIEFDDFPNNTSPDLKSLESIFSDCSESVFEKKSHDFASIPDTDETIDQQSDFGIDIHGHPSAIVNGCVNVVSGKYQESATDFSLPGVRPLNVQRNYFGGKCKKSSFLYGWQLSHGAKLFSLETKDQFYAFIKGSDRHGVRFKDTKSNGRMTCTGSSDEISGKYRSINLSNKMPHGSSLD